MSAVSFMLQDAGVMAVQAGRDKGCWRRSRAEQMLQDLITVCVSRLGRGTGDGENTTYAERKRPR